MAWTTPRTWVAGEKPSAATFNAHVRDNQNVLKTSIDDNGYLRPLLKGFGYSAGQGNSAGGADTQLSSFDVTIPASCLAQPGDCLVVEGVLALAANTNAKTFKMQVASGTTVTIVSNAANVAAHIVPFRVTIRRRTQTTGGYNGLSWPGAAAGGAPANYLVNAAITGVDWAVSQTLKFFASGTSAADVLLTDVYVSSARSNAGSLV